MLGRQKRTWTNECELRRELFVIRYATSKKAHSTKQSSAGNLAGKTLARLHNIPNLLRKFLEFESSPGHHNFSNFQ